MREHEAKEDECEDEFREMLASTPLGRSVLEKAQVFRLSVNGRPAELFVTLLTFRAR